MDGDSITSKKAIDRRTTGGGDGKHPHDGAKPSHAIGKATDAQAAPPEDPARKAYETAQAAYQKELDVYWAGVEASKRARKKVTSFPPFYKGPEKPPNFDPPKEPSTLPSVNDMLAAYKTLAPIAAAAAHSKLPYLTVDETSESEFKRAYAREAIHVGAKYGLNKVDTQNIVQSIYAFEDAGRGTADMLSGVPLRLTAPDAPGSHANKDERRAIHPLSTAMGYNQLLTATSLQFVDGSNSINSRLQELEKSNPARAKELAAKEQLLAEMQATVHKEIMQFAQSNKARYLDAHGQPNYALYTDFAKSSVKTSLGMTGRQLSSAIQALNLDRDIGPVLQAREIDELFSHGLNPTYKGLLEQKSKDDAVAVRAYDAFSAKEKEAAVKELMDRVAPVAAKPGGPAPSAYDQVARNILAAHLLAFGNNRNTPLTPDSLGPNAFNLYNSKVLTMKKYGDAGGPLHPATRALVDAVFLQAIKQPSGNDYFPAAVELGNLAGVNNADAMLAKQNSSYPTVNFFDRGGYQRNGIVNGRTSDELLKAIYRSMHGANGSPQNPGMADMIRAFNSQ